MNRISIETVGGFTTVWYRNRYYGTMKKSLFGILASLFWQRSSCRAALILLSWKRQINCIKRALKHAHKAAA